MSKTTTRSLADLGIMNGKETTTKQSQTTKILGSQIDPENAEVTYVSVPTSDPYSVMCNHDEREYFARSPDSSVWVSFGDLPESICDALWEKHRDPVSQLKPATLQDQYIDEALRRAAKMGLIADSGRKRFSKRTGCFQIMWKSFLTPDRTAVS